MNQQPQMALSETIITYTVAFLLYGISVVVCRQMCYTCQFVLNGPGKECVTAPRNWTGGEIRIKCPNKCTTMAEYDAVTGKPTFFHRGCGVAGDQKDACIDNGARHSCFYSCGDGENYCNDKALPRSPLMDKVENMAISIILQASPFSVVFQIALFATAWAVLGHHL